MKIKSPLSIFAIVLILTSIMRLCGLSLHPIVEWYEQVGLTIMGWFLPSLSSEVFPTGIKALVICIPLLFLVNIAIFITLGIQHIREKLHERTHKHGECCV